MFSPVAPATLLHSGLPLTRGPRGAGEDQRATLHPPGNPRPQAGGEGKSLCARSITMVIKHETQERIQRPTTVCPPSNTPALAPEPRHADRGPAMRGA